MKNMKLLLLIVIGAFVVNITLAQTTVIRGGLNFCNMHQENDNATLSDDFDNNLGFNVGFTAEFKINEVIFIESGLLLNQKGFKFEHDVLGIETSKKLNLYYADVPLAGMFKFDLQEVKIIAGAGGYIGGGFYGKEITKVGDKEEKEDVEWANNSDESDLKRLDYGLYFNGAIEFKRVRLGASYQYGLANTSDNTSNGFKSQHRVLSLYLGFVFD